MALLVLYSAHSPGGLFPQRGDVLTIREDDFEWGSQEHLANGFLVVRMPGEPTDEIFAQLMVGSEEQFRDYYVDFESVLSPEDLAEIAASDWLVPDVPVEAVRVR